MSYTHTIEYYSATKGDKILTHATTWMNLENRMLSEISQTQKGTYCMISFTQDTRISKFVETECMIEDTRD